MRTSLKFASRALATFVMVAGALVLTLGVVVPRFAGATTYAVLANSMAPRYPMGTLIVARPSDTISTGDVITFQVNEGNPEVVTHRVAAIGFTTTGEPRFTTKGDANNIADPGTVRPEQIRGVLWYALPYLGYLVVAVNRSREYFTLALALALGAYALWQVFRTIVEKPKPQPVVAPAPPEPGYPPEPIYQLVALESPPVTRVAEPFRPTMTRAERKRLASLNPIDIPDYSLVS